MRIADPPPGFCSVCYAANPDRRFVDFEADYDGAPVLDPETKTIAVLPWTGALGGHDNLYVCENCVRDAAELINFKPERNLRQLEEMAKLSDRVDYWRLRAERAEQNVASHERYVAALEHQLPKTPRPPGRPRKVAA